jgi:hypothetical protein
MLMMLSLSQRLQLLPSAILPSCLHFFDDVMLNGLNSFRRKNFAWKVGH